MYLELLALAREPHVGRDVVAALGGAALGGAAPHHVTGLK